MRVNEARIFAIEAHGDQKYGDFPYSVHLDSVHFELVSTAINVPVEVRIAAYLHDTVEDTDVTVSDVQNAFGARVAELVELVTDKPGKNRKERHAATYPAIGRDREATMIKLADRIANSAMSLTYEPGILKMYRKEQPIFREYLYNQEHGLAAMWHRLGRLLG